MRKVWKQIGGSTRFAGALLGTKESVVLARVIRGRSPRVEIWAIDREPTEEPDWMISSATIPVADLEWADNKDVAKMHGHSRQEWEDANIEHRAMDRFNLKPRESGATYFGATKWSEALPGPSSSIAWW